MYPLDHQQVLHSFWRDDRYNWIAQDIRMKPMFVRLLVLGFRDYVAEQAPHGSLTESQIDAALEHACLLTRVSPGVSRGEVKAALIERNEIARKGDGTFKMVDWYSHTGRAFRRRSQDAQRKQRSRGKCHADVTRTSRGLTLSSLDREDKVPTVSPALGGADTTVGVVCSQAPAPQADLPSREDLIKSAKIEMGECDA